METYDRKKKMKAANWYGPMDLRLEEVEIPKVDKGEILVKVDVALTCGTDVKIYSRGHAMVEPPYRLGHEFVGTVVEIGDGVDNVKIGDRIFTSNVLHCGSCFYCRKGQHNLCENILLLYGAYAEYILVPALMVEERVYILPATVPSHTICLVEPLSCALHAVNLSGIEIGDTVVVLGAGPLGLMVAKLSSMRGARVISVDKNESRLKVARKCGASYTVNASNDNTLEKIIDLTPSKRGADVAIEAIGLPETWEQTIALARKGGTAVLFGGCPAGTSITVDTKLLHYSEITIKGAFNTTPDEIQTSIKLLEDGEIDPELFISGEFSLDNIKIALEKHMKQEGIKYAIIP